MKSFGNGIGLLVLAGIAYYFWSISSQTAGAEKLCAAHPPGTRLVSPATAADAFGVRFMGSQDATQWQKTGKLIFCATLTMCDVSCVLDVEDGVVTRATFSRL